MKKGELSESLAEVSVKYSSKIKAGSRPRVTSSEDAIKIFREIWDEGTIELHESMYVLLLNRANYVLGWYRHTIGGLCGTIGDPRLIYGVALKCLAVSIILAHNHPSGNTEPSPTDRQLTKNLVEAGRFLEITLLDHIILTVDAHYSFADDGVI